MARVRYETRCGGRLLKVTEQVEVPEFHDAPYPHAQAAADATAAYRAQNTVPVVDGRWWWIVDDHQVADDVARAMLAEYGEQP